MSIYLQDTFLNTDWIHKTTKHYIRFFGEKHGAVSAHRDGSIPVMDFIRQKLRDDRSIILGVEFPPQFEGVETGYFDGRPSHNLRNLHSLSLEPEFKGRIKGVDYRRNAEKIGIDLAYPTDGATEDFKTKLINYVSNTYQNEFLNHQNLQNINRFSYEYKLGKIKNSIMDGEILKLIHDNIHERNLLFYVGDGHIHNVASILEKDRDNFTEYSTIQILPNTNDDLLIEEP